MEDFIFAATDPGETITFDFEPSLFHHPSHLYLQQPQGWKWYYVLHPRHKRVVASLYLHISDQAASSTVRSPFGTVECSDAIPAETLFQFLLFVEENVRSLGVRQITIKNPPLHYHPDKGSLLQTFLFNLGYNVIDAEVGTIRITDTGFENELNRLESRQLKKAIQAKLKCKLLPHNSLEEVYSLIIRCRQRKGYSLSMTCPDLERTFASFPDRYILLGVFQNEELIAASIAVRVTSGILYNFYADHVDTFDSLSPMVFLVKGLYEYCQQHNIPVLDLGTSAANGQPNFGLLNFKLRLGGKPSPKLTFEKILTP